MRLLPVFAQKMWAATLSGYRLTPLSVGDQRMSYLTCVPPAQLIIVRMPVQLHATVHKTSYSYMEAML